MHTVVIGFRIEIENNTNYNVTRYGQRRRSKTLCNYRDDRDRQSLKLKCNIYISLYCCLQRNLIKILRLVIFLRIAPTFFVVKELTILFKKSTYNNHVGFHSGIRLDKTFSILLSVKVKIPNAFPARIILTRSYRGVPYKHNAYQ